MKSLYQAFLCMVLVVSGLSALQSCKPSIPSQYLSRGEMEDILYDIHLAEAMSNVNASGADSVIMISYREAVLKKHGVTSADFDSSMVYYMRHTKLLHEIYLNLGERLTAEAQSLGADVNELNRLGGIVTGDTANVWNAAPSLVLSAQAPFNYSSFEIPVDSGFHKGDKLMLTFDSQFLFQDGMRDGMAVVAITFKNDSVYSSNVHISGSQHYSLQMDDRDSLGIKSVKGYFLLNSGDYSSGSASTTTLKMMFLQNIRLIRLHPDKQQPGKPSDNGGNGGPKKPQDLKPVSSDSASDRPRIPADKLDKIEVSDEKLLPKRDRR